MRAWTKVGLALILAAVSAAAAKAQQAPPTCVATEHRQFDFWVGDWEVVDTAGTVLGHNRVTREKSGCVIHEHWTGSRGMTGESFNLYDRSTGMWHQTWVSSTGALLLLDGGLVNGDMVLRGETQGPNGTQLQRITWRRLDGGNVLQLWETSSDAGATWSEAFRGIYRPVTPGAAS